MAERFFAFASPLYLTTLSKSLFSNGRSLLLMRWAAAATVVAGTVFLIFATAAPSVPVARNSPPWRVVQDRIWFSEGHHPALPMPGGQMRSVKSLLNIRSRMEFGDYVWNEANIPSGVVWVRIDLASQMLSVFRGSHEIGTAVILYGTDGKPTPTGLFPILDRAIEHRSSLYDAEMPYMLRLTTDGVAIHASNVRQGSATHGCIGVPLSFARLLYGQTRRGDVVAILGNDKANRRS